MYFTMNLRIIQYTTLDKNRDLLKKKKNLSKKKDSYCNANIKLQLVKFSFKIRYRAAKLQYTTIYKYQNMTFTTSPSSTIYNTIFIPQLCRIKNPNQKNYNIHIIINTYI